MLLSFTPVVLSTSSIPAPSNVHLHVLYWLPTSFALVIKTFTKWDHAFTDATRSELQILRDLSNEIGVFAAFFGKGNGDWGQKKEPRAPKTIKKTSFWYLKTRFFGGENRCFSWFWVLQEGPKIPQREK